MKDPSDPRRSTTQIKSDRAIAKIPGDSSGCSVSAQMDRALKKFLAYPIFDQPFRDAVCDVGLGRSEFWMVLELEEDSGEQVFDMIPAMGGSPESKALLSGRHDLIMILADMVQKGKKTVFSNLFTDLGFGAGSHDPTPKSKPPGSVLQSAVDQGAIKRPNPHSSPATCVSLKAQEDTEKSKWAVRLQKIATKAGAAAKINGPARDGLSVQEDEAIKSIVLKSGAFRTMRQNVRAFEKFDQRWGCRSTHRQTQRSPSTVCTWRDRTAGHL